MTEMEDAKYIDLIAKYLSGNLEPIEKQDLMTWVEASEANQAYFDEMIQLWGITENYEEQFETDVSAAWQTLNTKLPKVEVEIEKTSKVIPLGRIIRIAAAVIVLSGIGLWWYSNQDAGIGEQTIMAQTLEGEQKTINLPDGSTVWLNERTTLTYSAPFTQRNVRLDGEAFFKVDRQEANPFTISSGEATTTVLGTSFNVRAYPDETAVEVTVEEGKVSFKKETKEEVKEIFLAAGKSGVYNKTDKTIETIEEELVNANAWKTQVLEFPSQELATVITTLERYFGKDIAVTNDEILKCDFMMGKEENPSLDLVFQIMEFSMGYKIEKTGADSYNIKGQGCN